MSPLVLLLLSTVVLCFSLAFSVSTVSHLPGLRGPLPFHLETGYIVVDESLDVELFYYFVKSEGDPGEDPLLLWLTGGPGCSAFSALAFEIGPITFERARYNGSLPNLSLNPYSWSKIANVIFLDSPVGSGFSFSRSPQGHQVGEIRSSKQVYAFMIKWFAEHPQFLANPFYIAGDSHAGKVTPLVVHTISQGLEAGEEPLINLKGYLIGNPSTGERVDRFSRVPYAFGMGMISYELYEMTMKHCVGRDYDNPGNAECAKNLDVLKKLVLQIEPAHILEASCPFLSPKPEESFMGDRRSPGENCRGFLALPPIPSFRCRSYVYYLSYVWANNDMVRRALHVQKRTVGEWQRCNSDVKSNYIYDVPSSLKYHLDLTSRGYRALVYSGDHDMVIPHLGTEAWIRSLNFSIAEEWRSWWVDGQVAGYTRSYFNDFTFATVKGAGHTAPEYRPRECLAMFKRWISNNPL